MIYSESGDYIWRIQNKLLTLLYKQEAIVTAQAVLHIYSSIGCTGQIGILINFSESPRQVVYLMACRYCAFNAAWGSDYRGRGTLKSLFTRSFIIFTGTAFFLSFSQHRACAFVVCFLPLYRLSLHYTQL